MMLQASRVIASSQVVFGTSGARGLVEDFTPDACAAFTHAFVDVMKKRFGFEAVALGIDNRPSSPAMAAACSAALIEQGITPVFYGVLPTPALAFASMQAAIPAIMVTGSHIPFDRNGLKFYRPDGEISKADEQAINQADVTFAPVTKVPSLEAKTAAAEHYIQRYQQLLPEQALLGRRIGIYEHSSAGRELYGRLFEALGAEVVSLGRSDQFVPIDTEAVSIEDKVRARQWTETYKLDMLFSTDGDGDRPLIADEQGQWFRGDDLGLLCSKALRIDALAVPVSCTTAIEKSGFFKEVVRTRIGSPYVIDAFSALAGEHEHVAGFEANGGYLLASSVTVNGEVLAPLPTRDALLPALMLLALAGDKPLSSLRRAIPQRFTHSDRLQNVPRERSQALLAQIQASTESILGKMGLSEGVVSINTTDGIRITFANECIVHFRPSGNAPELRCYAEAETPELAEAIVTRALSYISKMEFA